MLVTLNILEVSKNVFPRLYTIVSGVELLINVKIKINSNVAVGDMISVYVWSCLKTTQWKGAVEQQRAEKVSLDRVEGLRGEQCMFYPRLWHRCSGSLCLLFHFIHPSNLLCLHLHYRAYLELLERLVKQVSLAGRCSKKKKKE